MTSSQNIIDHVRDQMQKGLITADQGNVLKVQMQGVCVIHGKLHASVRKALNEAVRNGELGHIKRDGLRPEVYHHKNARAKALEARDAEFKDSIGNLSKVYTN